MTYTFQDFEAQGEEIRALTDQIRTNRLVHALMITGEPGTGKRTLAELLAAALLCTAEGEKPCGQCRNCLAVFSGEHPDLIRIEKGVPIAEDVKKGRATIPVEDIREMIRRCSEYSLTGERRVVLIAEAENMTPQAQNCLLKILEEPPAGTCFLLSSSHPEQVLTTVRSRCRQVNLSPWPDDYILRVLKKHGTDDGRAALIVREASGSIGYALQLSADEAYWQMREEIFRVFFGNFRRSDILSFSTAWKDRKGDAPLLFDILEHSVRNLLLLRFGQIKENEVGSFSEAWFRFSRQADLSRFPFLFDRIGESRKQLSFNVNFQAILEQLLLVFIGESEVWSR